MASTYCNELPAAEWCAAGWKAGRMPGGRLAHSDRRYIAEALAQGLGYTEIARRLRRPTSTVSREVARNGGRDGYDAEAAHRSTARRARRRSPAPDPGGAETPSRSGRDAAAIRDFERRYTAMMIDTGMPPMPARVLVSLLLSDTGRLTAAELVRRLHVSPASVSKAVAYLETISLLRRGREPGARREQYIVEEGMWADAWVRALQLQLVWSRFAAEGARLLGEDTDPGSRLAEMAEFIELMNASLHHELHRLRAEFDRRRSPS